jgi:hypothetical protein
VRKPTQAKLYNRRQCKWADGNSLRVAGRKRGQTPHNIACFYQTIRTGRLQTGQCLIDMNGAIGGGLQQSKERLMKDQLSFYDESLKKQIEGSYRTDGRAVHVRSPYGILSAPYGDRDTYPDKDGLDLLARKLLIELARDAGAARFKELQRQKGDDVQPRESFSGSALRG